MTLNKAMLWIVTVLAVAFLFFPTYVGLLPGGDGHTTVTDDMHRAKFTVEGMTCEGCASIVSTAIRTVPGVQAVEVDYETGIAIVGSDNPVLTDQVVDALKRAGYKGTLGKLLSTTTEPPASSNVSPDRQSLHDLSDDVREFRHAFNAAKGQVRVLMLVSPG